MSGSMTNEFTDMQTHKISAGEIQQMALPALLKGSKLLLSPGTPAHIETEEEGDT